MAAQMTIRRLPTEAVPGSFDRLRSDGIALLQALSSERWTDYNLHDPGITMLEQLCFALTELAYRADLPVADLLTGADGKIDFARQSLHLPEVIYPCRPTTPEDIRRALLDRVPDANAVAISTGKAAGVSMPGLYRFDVRLAGGSAETAAGGGSRDSEGALLEVVAAYRRIRNVGEDIETIALIQEAPCRLGGEIEIGGARDPVDILADVYDRCDRLISAPPAYASIDALKQAGRTPDEVFDGPSFASGLLRSAQGGEPGSQLFVGDLSREIAAIEGVRAVKALSLAIEGGEPQSGAVDWCWRVVAEAGAGAAQSAALKALVLHVPQTPNEAHIRLVRRGTQVRIAVREAALKFFDLRTARRSRRQSDPGRSGRFPRPVGEFPALPPFQSSQIHFPDVYGLNRFGVPESAPLKERMAMWQLKGFLALCDQVMANAAAQIQNVRELYCAAEAEQATYWWHLLSDDELPHISRLYTAKAKHAEDNVFARFDARIDRRNRVFDYLLALHGESFSQDSLRKFADYFDEAELSLWLLRNKAVFLRDIVRLARDRSGGFDYAEGAWQRADNCAGLQRRIGVLLGFADGSSRSLTAALSDRNLSVPTDRPGSLMKLSGSDRVLRLPFEWPAIAPNQVAAVDARVKQLLRTDSLGCLLRAGLHRENYRLLHRGAGPQCQLLLAETRIDQPVPTEFLSLGAFDHWEQAAQCAALLRTSLLGLNQRCEGMHLVEHCLLRPVLSGGKAAVDQSFYALRLTFIFPAWTARGHLDDSQRTRLGDFRRFVTETVQINCPAHLRPQCLWFDFDTMRAFERDYRAWLQAKSEWCRAGRDAAAAQQVDLQASRVVRHLLANGADVDVSPRGAAT